MHLTQTHLLLSDLPIYMDQGHASNSHVLDPFTRSNELTLHQPLHVTSHHNHPPEDDGISLDSRRLRTQHTVEGYRDGITSGKVECIQAGFDEGFNVGAFLGLKVGRILGFMEGVSTALKETGHQTTHIDHLVSDAAKDLSTHSVFSEDYWASDGGWKYLVNGSTSTGEVLLEDVANEHPIIMKWEKIVNQEAMKLSLDGNLPILCSDASQLEGEEALARSQSHPQPVVDW
ncbi:uncharacterized protein GGS22DRAFT_159945 [Annulohypoxylon maeteangense]|uniref:uncharacterized protein n=1 Tax=Annulohypoxylon maeteangense TaxID=1927788 RepID=UPI0020079601|nr:uncharacterized protein GGS22DRAFT_159945 [Annulohypoxylon maeteangense]KAI0886108.1 hypothetical protein GGS22DRAFT_159945 [Annulohypoxylon maeteangense]